MCAIASLEIVIRPSGDESTGSASTLMFDRRTSAGVAPRRERRAAGASDGLLDLAGFETAGADVGALRLAAQEHADTLQVRVEAALGGDHRMAPVVAEAGLLAANGADLGHRRRSVAGAVMWPATLRG